MSVFVLIYGGLVLIFVGFLLLAARRLPPLWRAAAGISGSALAIVGFIATTELLSRPKPIELETFRQHISEIEIIAARIIRNNGIYILAQLPDETAPRYYVLPWNPELADQLRKGMENNKRGLRMTNPFSWDRSWEDRKPPKIYEPPPEKLPPKMGVPEPETFKNPLRAL